jgi:hypothetical protein
VTEFYQAQQRERDEILEKLWSLCNSISEVDGFYFISSDPVARSNFQEASRDAFKLVAHIKKECPGFKNDKQQELPLTQLQVTAKGKGK